MDIGVPKEIKRHEYRVGLIPVMVRRLTTAGHRVFVERDCGLGSGFANREYEQAGAIVVATAGEVFGLAELVVKVKEPLPAEWSLLRPGQALFTYLHLAANAELTRHLLDSGCLAIAYETVTDSQGRLPLLVPMSQIAGRVAAQAGAHYLENTEGGRGVLMSALDGAPAANVVILGGGNVGFNAAWVALGMGAHVTIFDANPAKLAALPEQLGRGVDCLPADGAAIEDAVRQADLVIGSVLIPGARAPMVIDRQLVREMAPGTVLIDVAIDQGGCFETSRPTNLDDPIYVEEGVIHYCVTNMPSAVARSSTLELNHITGPYVLKMAEQGVMAALRSDGHLRNGVNVYNGQVIHPAVAASLGYRAGVFDR